MAKSELLLLDPRVLTAAADVAGVDLDFAQELLRPQMSMLAERGAGTTSDLAEAIRRALQERVDREGVEPAAAALMLGLTEASFGALAAGPYGLPVRRDGRGEVRFLREELDAFVRAYLPRFKTFASRSSLLREFHRQLAERSRDFQPAEQRCESDDCTNLAAHRCANPHCRAGASPRKVCPRHQEHLEGAQDQRLCDACARRAVAGELPEFRLAGSPERLRQEYGNG